MLNLRPSTSTSGEKLQYDGSKPFKGRKAAQQAVKLPMISSIISLLCQCKPETEIFRLDWRCRKHDGASRYDSAVHLVDSGDIC